MRSLALSLALGLGTIASVAAAQVPQKLPTTRTVDTVNAVTVQNNRSTPVAVFLEYGKFDRRLGIVPAGRTATLRLPPWAYQGLRNVRLFAQPEGEVVVLASQEFELAKAAQLTLMVPARGEVDVAPADTMSQVIPAEDLAEATLTVDNARDVGVTVYARHGNLDVRIGRVEAKGRTTLRFPRVVVGERSMVTLFVHLDGGRDLETETLEVKRGQHLGLRVPPR